MELVMTGELLPAGVKAVELVATGNYRCQEGCCWLKNHRCLLEDYRCMKNHQWLERLCRWLHGLLLAICKKLKVG